jgi:hypothetical protein
MLYTHLLQLSRRKGSATNTMSYYGISGPVATIIHAGIRIMMDQTVELISGTSVLP